jgi:heme/copper-type cytochrome/quinol oxidase subunit 2
MGAAISALPRAVGIVKRNPILIVGSVLFGLFALVGVVFSLIPLIGGIIFQVLILPVGLAGIVAMADAGTGEGDSSLGDFTGGISNHATSMIGAFGLMFLIQLAVAIALVVVIVFVIGFSIVGASVGTESDPGAVFAGVGLLTGLVLLAVILVVVALQLVQQFLDVAVVVGGEDAAGALSEAASLVTGGPLSVLGYALLRFVVLGVAVAAPLVLAVAVGGVGAARDTAALLVPAVLLMLVAFPLGVALGFAYHVAYYRERRPDAADPASDAGDGNADVVSPPSAGD